jgi:hypothetical protein
MYDVLIYCIFLISPLSMIAQAVFLYIGFRNQAKISPKYLAVAATWFILSCGYMIAVGFVDTFLWNLWNLISGAIAAIICGYVLILYLKGIKKFVGVIFVLLIPLTLLISFFIGSENSPDARARRNGKTLVAGALQRYYTNHHTYPASLSDLQPDYLDDLHEPSSLWGWLYHGEGTDYSLGYVTYIDKFGYSICKISASSPEWVCPDNHVTEPFVLQPTPTPGR